MTKVSGCCMLKECAAMRASRDLNRKYEQTEDE